MLERSEMNTLLKPFIWLAGWLVMRDLKKWAKTPLLFDTESNWELISFYLQKLQEAYRAEGEILDRMLKITRQLKQGLCQRR